MAKSIKKTLLPKFYFEREREKHQVDETFGCKIDYQKKKKLEDISVMLTISVSMLKLAIGFVLF